MADTSFSTRVKAPADTDACNRPASNGANMKGRASSLFQDGSSRIMDGQQTSKADLRSATRFATWNALTLNGVGYQVALVKQLAKYRIAIAGITEARLPGNGQRMVDDAIILHSGGTDHTRGVALVLRQPLKNSLVTWHPISPRLLYARLLHCYGHLSLVTAYAPTEDSETLEKDSFYDQLAATIQSIPKHDEILVLGDMNANPGPRIPGFEDVIGPFGTGTTNDNSHRLLSLCSSTGLMATGSWFQRRDIHRFTWISNDGHTRKELDHILACPLNIVRSYRVFRGAEAPANTDHHLLIAEIAIAFRHVHKQKRCPQLNVQCLRDDPDRALQYNITLNNKFEALGNLPDGVEAAWTSISDIIRGSAEEVVGYKKTRRQPWLSDDALDTLEEKAAARLKGDKAERKRLNGVFKAKSKRDKEAFYQTLATEAEEGLQRNNLKAAYRTINRIRGTRQSTGVTATLKADGSPCLNQAETLNRWREYFSKALNHPPAEVSTELTNEASTASDSPDVSIDMPTLGEVRTAIQKLRHGRAAGPDGIPPELLKCAIDPVSTVLHELISRVWTTGHVPAQWKEGIVLALYKGRGPKTECSSHRPITLLSVPGKVFAHVLLARLNPLLTAKRRPQQSGFTAGRSTMDAILALRLLSEIHREFNRPLQVAYVDLKSAFDSVDRQALWMALRGIGVPTFLLNLIKDLHEGTTARVRINGILSEQFFTASGVRQGCVLAPALFCRAMDWILEHAIGQAGITLPEHSFSDLDYADDVALLETSVMNLETSLNQIESTASKLGLHVSWTKTKLQNLGSGGDAGDIYVNGHQVENVPEFTYLGSVQSSDGRCQRDITRRIGIAASAMRSLQNLWRQRQIQLSTKIRVYQACVLPILLYGSETWTLQTRDSQRLQAFHMRCQRQLLCIRWFDFVTNEAISKQTALLPVTDIIARRRLSLFGHVARQDSNIPAHRALACAIARRTETHPPPNWRRPPGRPRRTWPQQIGDGLPSTILHEWHSAIGRGHNSRSTRLAQRTSVVHVI